MSNNWFVSDWHLGIDNFTSEPFLARPFSSKEEHVDVLIKEHNKLVKKDDTVYVIGDVIDEDANSNEYLKIINEFNGEKILIRGNHDIKITDEQFKPYFKHIVKFKSGIFVSDENYIFYLTHYPTQTKLNFFNLVGHVHLTWRYQLNMLNVGVDVNNFKPHSWESIKFHYNFISTTTNKSAFAAYLEENSYYSNRIFKNE